MSNKTSDENVANIEDDIKILTEENSSCKKEQAIQHILAELEQKDKQIDLMAFNLADYIMYYEYDKCRNPEIIKNKAKELKRCFERKVKDVKNKR